MAKTETLNLEVKSNIKSVAKDTDKMADSLEDVNKEAQEGIGNFTLMGVSLNGVKAAFGKVIPMAKAMFGSIKAGLISTGIGAFVVLIGSLVSYFTQTKRGAELLERGMAALGAVVSVVTDLFSSVGEKAVSAFTDPKKAITDLWEFIKDNLMNRLTGMVDGFMAAGKIIESALSFDWDAVKEGALDYGTALIQVATGMDLEQQKKFLEGIKDIGEELKTETNAMVSLTKASQELADAQRALNVETAEAVADIEKLKLKAEDITKTYKEREEAANSAFKKETDLENKRITLAEEAVRIQKEKMAMSENTAEDLDALAELEINLANVRQESAGRQISLQNFLNSLRQTEAAEQDAIWEKKIADNDAWNEKQIADAKKVADAKIAEAERVAAEEKAITQAVNAFKKATTDKVFGAATAMAGENVALSKGIAAAQTIYNTQQGIMAAMGATSIADKLLPFPLRLANAIATGVMGAAALSTIMSTSPTSGGGGGVPSAGAATPAPQMMSGAFDLGSGQEIEPVQAYVVSDEITDSQNALEIIRRRATI